jgi:hypothetical protein
MYSYKSWIIVTLPTDSIATWPKSFLYSTGFQFSFGCQHTHKLFFTHCTLPYRMRQVECQIPLYYLVWQNQEWTQAAKVQVCCWLMFELGLLLIWILAHSWYYWNFLWPHRLQAVVGVELHHIPWLEVTCHSQKQVEHKKADTKLELATHIISCRPQSRLVFPIANKRLLIIESLQEYELWTKLISKTAKTAQWIETQTMNQSFRRHVTYMFA